MSITAASDRTYPVPTSYIYTCRWCGWAHAGVCPRVKAIEYHPNGEVKRVEFFDSAFGQVIANVSIAPSKHEEEI